MTNITVEALCYDIPDIDIRRYDEVKTHLVDLYKNLDEVHTVYSFGSIGCPGVSDLDLVVITEPRLSSHARQVFGEWKRFPDVCLHSPFFMAREKVGELTKIHSFMNLEVLYDKGTAFSEISHRNSQSSFADFVDFTNYLAVAFAQMLMRSVPSVRKRLVLWRSWEHTCQVFQNVFGSDSISLEKINPVKDVVESLRTTIMSPQTRSEGMQQLVELESRLPELFCNLYREVDRIALERGWISDSKENWRQRHPISFYVDIGTSDEYFENAFHVRRTGWKVRDRIIIPMPRCFWAAFSEYGNVPNQWGKWHRRLYGTNQNACTILNQKLVTQLHTRLEASYQATVKHNGVTPAPLGFGYAIPGKKLFRYWLGQCLKYSRFLDSNKMKKLALDLGCGCGANVSLLKKKGYDYFGVDISESNLDTCRKKFPNMEEKFIFTDGARLPFETSSVDAVFAFDVLEHVDDLQSVLDEIDRILKPGGDLVVTLPCPVSEKWIASFYPQYPADIHHVRILSPEGLQKKLANYSVVSLGKEEAIQNIELFLYWLGGLRIIAQLGTWTSPRRLARAWQFVVFAFSIHFTKRVFVTKHRFLPLWIVGLPVGFLVDKVIPKTNRICLRKN